MTCRGSAWNHYFRSNRCRRTEIIYSRTHSVYYTLELMKTTTLILFFALFSTQVFAQREAQEFPWSKAAKIISADEAKSRGGKKIEQQPEADSKRTGKKMDAENKKSDRDYSAGTVDGGK